MVSSGFGGNPMDPGLNKAALMHSKTCTDESEYPQANGMMANSRIRFLRVGLGHKG